jgi:glutathione S-transferase
VFTIHHLGLSQSERIVWLCEELELPYELARYKREPGTGLAPPEYKALHPFGTAPVITDGDLVLGESGAIVEYLCRRYADGRLILGPDHPDFVSYLYWFHFANGSLIPSIMMDNFAPKVEPTQSVAPGRSPASRLERALNIIEARLGEATFFAGEAFTAADIMMCLMRFFARRDLTPYPNTRTYMQRIVGRPAAQRAMATAEPDLPRNMP